MSMLKNGHFFGGAFLLASLCIGIFTQNSYSGVLSPTKQNLLASAKPAPATCTYKVNFINESLEKGIDQINSTGKTILFAATKSRQCGSCDVLACDIFNNPEVVGLLNNNFVNVNLDLDEGNYFHLKGSQEIGKSPAFLFFTSNGYLVDKVTDIKDAKDLVEQATKVLKRYQNIDLINLQQDRDEYSIGRRDPEFLYNLAFKMKAAGLYYNTIVSDYFKTQTVEELQAQKNRMFIYEFSDNIENSAIDNFLLDLPYFKAGMNSDKANEHIKMAIRNSIASAINDRDQTLFAKSKRIIEKAYLPNSESFLYYIQSEYFEGIKDWESFAKITTKHIQDYKITDADFLNTVALKYFLYVNDKARLKDAEGWLLKSIGIESEYENNFLLARLYRKMGKCNDAKNYALTAIEIAQIRREQGIPIDYNEAGKFLDSLRERGCGEPEP